MHQKVLKINIRPSYNSENTVYLCIFSPKTEEDTYGLLAIMAASKRAKYLYLSKNEFDIASMTAYELSRKFAKKHLAYIEVSSSQEEVMNLFSNWLWWIFHYLPFTHVVST